MYFKIIKFWEEVDERYPPEELITAPEIEKLVQDFRNCPTERGRAYIADEILDLLKKNMEQ